MTPKLLRLTYDEDIPDEVSANRVGQSIGFNPTVRRRQGPSVVPSTARNNYSVVRPSNDELASQLDSNKDAKTSTISFRKGSRRQSNPSPHSAHYLTTTNSNSKRRANSVTTVNVNSAAVKPNSNSNLNAMTVNSNEICTDTSIVNSNSLIGDNRANIEITSNCVTNNSEK